MKIPEEVYLKLRKAQATGCCNCGAAGAPVSHHDSNCRYRLLEEAIEALAAQDEPDPLPVRLLCPTCGGLHVDEGEWATRPHHTHAYQLCGEVWRPTVGPTVGVRFLPGFKDEEIPGNADIHIFPVDRAKEK